MRHPSSTGIGAFFVSSRGTGGMTCQWRLFHDIPSDQGLRKEPEDEMVALYVRLLQEQCGSKAEDGVEPAERSSRRSGPLTVRRLLLICARCGAQVAA